MYMWFYKSAEWTQVIVRVEPFQVQLFQLNQTYKVVLAVQWMFNSLQNEI